MGKKYIIELLDECNSEFKGIMVFGLTQEKQISVELIPEESLRPYTEPDMEQVKREAYEQGVNDANYAIADDSYKKGLSDAWEAARKIQDTGENLSWWIHNVSPSEAIEKIRQYEQEHKSKDGLWIMSEANEPSVDTTLICSKCGYAIKIKPCETPELNFCPKCGDCKNPKEEES